MAQSRPSKAAQNQGLSYRIRIMVLSYLNATMKTQYNFYECFAATFLQGRASPYRQIRAKIALLFPNQYIHLLPTLHI